MIACSYHPPLPSASAILRTIIIVMFFVFVAMVLSIIAILVITIVIRVVAKQKVVV